MLSIRQLTVAYGSAAPAVEGIDLDIAAGESWALVGPSGAGKSTIGLACLGLWPPTARVTGTVRIDDVDLIADSEDARVRVRGTRIAHVGQSPSASLNPAMRIGTQVAEVVGLRQRLDRSARYAFARARLAEVGLDDTYVLKWPHELSGGEQRRAVLAMALATDPALLVADEPTANLDTLNRAEVVRLLGRLQQDRGLGVLLITHDLRLAEALTDRVAVLRDGHIVEAGRWPLTVAAAAGGTSTVSRATPTSRTE